MTLTEVTLQNRELRSAKRENRPSDYGMANAAARKVRRDYPSNTIDATAAEYGLTYGEAKGVAYGTASRSTLDKMLKRGGWALVVELAADLLGQPLERFIEEQAREARREQAEREADARRWERLHQNYQAVGSEPRRADGLDP